MTERDDEAARRRRTIAGGLFALAVLAVALWVMQAVADRQALERCLNSGRRDCAQIPNTSERSYAPVR